MFLFKYIDKPYDVQYISTKYKILKEFKDFHCLRLHDGAGGLDEKLPSPQQICLGSFWSRSVSFHMKEIRINRIFGLEAPGPDPVLFIL